MNLSPDCTLGYTVGYEAWYWMPSREQSRYIRIGSDHAEGGCDWEFLIQEHLFQGRAPALFVEMFADSWQAFTEVPELFAALAAERPLTFTDLRAMLERVGARDVTVREMPRGGRDDCGG